MKVSLNLFAAAAVAATAALVATPRFAAAGETAEATGVTVGEAAPEFTLTDTNGDTHALSDFAGRVVVLEWTNPQCPFVKKFYGDGAMQGLQEQYTEEGVGDHEVVWLTIASSAPGKQGHMSPDEWNAHVEESGAACTAVLIDEDGAVGQRYAAKTTPHLYIIDAEGTLRYQGAIDDTPSTDANDIADATNYVATTMAALASGDEVSPTDTKPYGCSVKY